MSMFDNEEPERGPVSLMWIGAALAAVALIIGMAAPHEGSAWRLPAVLEERVATALITSGYGGLEIEMDGQRAVLRGIVEREQDKAGAQRAALSAAGAGGPWAGGVVSVDVSAVTVGEMQRPFTWSARRIGQRLELTGFTPSEQGKAAILEAAHAAFPNADTVDRMHVAGGAPSPSFVRTASQALRSLAALNTGEARIVDDAIVFIGDGNQASVTALRRVFAEPPAPFHSRLAVTVDGLDLDHPELQGLNLASGDAETCEHAFDRLMERNVINFDEGSAVVQPRSRPVLDSLASVALRCDRFRIEVAGHTDDTGARETNMELSRERADAVANYLAAQGVARTRLTARGYGPDRPRASNTTEAGQAANRRIEFYVTG